MSVLPHDSIAMLRKCCPHCYGRDIIGPYEMDGVVDGQYHPRGLRWVTCRECNRTSLAREGAAA